jgi:hypothetical protein
MAILANFRMIIGDGSVHVPNLAGGAQFALPDFDTSDRDSNSTALLVFSVRNLTTTATVHINDQNVGTITPTSGAFWTAQQIAANGAQLKDGNNEIVVRAVGDLSGFDIKNLVCFFHQSSGPILGSLP